VLAADPDGVVTESHGAPGNTFAVQLTGDADDTFTKNELPALPGAPPTDVWNCAPEGCRASDGFVATKSVAGTTAVPAALAIVMVVR
jgi:hypothetical protein